ncbi:MAG: I/LWEQ domain-containing protein, partial [Olpidium bornovanus]
VEAAARRFSNEKQELLRSAQERQVLVEDLLRKLEAHAGELERVKSVGLGNNTLWLAKDEEVAILQAGMDQCLQQMADLSLVSGNRDGWGFGLHKDSNESVLQETLNKLLADMAAKSSRVLDAAFTSCIKKIDESIYEYESPANQGNVTATPEYTINMVENVTAAGNQFAAALTKYLSGSSDETEVMVTANDLSEATGKLLHNSKGVSRLVDDDAQLEELLDASKESAEQAINVFRRARSDRMNELPLPERSGAVMRANRELQSTLENVTKLTDRLIRKSASLTAGAGDIGDVVEREMHNAARVIEEAAARLEALMNKPKDPNLNATELAVHGSILDSAMAMTSAIANLIKCATASQQEIVAHGRGSSTIAAFYKKNNRWTEGLVSAAKAVAVATHTLVEAADGVIHGTHSMEQLIVASNEVGFATAQLVAASRVKAVPLSKTQDRLEQAAKAVTHASAALVKVVRQIVARQLEERAQQIDFSTLAPHEYKVREMEQQVQILTLEKELAQARRVLAEMRKVGYHAEEEGGSTGYGPVAGHGQNYQARRFVNLPPRSGAVGGTGAKLSLLGRAGPRPAVAVRAERDLTPGRGPGSGREAGRPREKDRRARG